MVCYPHTHSLLDKWIHFKKGFMYTIKEPETSIGNDQVSRDIIPYIFLKETQRIILRLNKTPPFLRKNFWGRGGGFIKQYKVVIESNQ